LTFSLCTTAVAVRGVSILSSRWLSRSAGNRRAIATDLASRCPLRCSRCRQLVAKLDPLLQLAEIATSSSRAPGSNPGGPTSRLLEVWSPRAPRRLGRASRRTSISSNNLTHLTLLRPEVSASSASGSGSRAHRLSLCEL
jgi:hypothetical protein